MVKRTRTKSRAAQRYSKYQKPSPYNRVGTAVVGVPTGMRVSMKYNTIIYLNSAITGYGHYVFRGMSIFDPDLSGAGHQPMGHDQWATLYGRYRVLGSSIKCIYNDELDVGAFGQVPIQIALAIRESQTDPLDYSTIAETPIARHGTLGRYNTATLSLPYTPAWKVRGEKGTLTDDASAATFGANPTRDNYYHIVAQRFGTTSINCRINVMITYDVWMFDPVPLTLS